MGHAQSANGIKLGDARLHPFLQLDGHHILNPGRIDGNTDTDFELVPRPGLELLWLTKAVELKMGADYQYQFYVQNSQLRSSGGHLSLAADINKEGSLSVGVTEVFTRATDPANQTTAAPLRHISNTAALKIEARPGGGALIFSSGYGFFIDRYDRGQGNPALVRPRDLDNYRHLPNLRVAWKFLPKTAVFINGDAIITRYNSSDINVSSNFILAQMGLIGNVTPKLALLAQAGYGNTLMNGNDNFSSFVGQLELSYDFTEVSKLKIGALRTVQPAALFKYMAVNRGYLGYDQAIASKILVSLHLSYDYQNFGRALRPPTVQRNDSVISANVSVTYQATEWLALSIIDNLDYRKSDYTTFVGTKVDYFYNDIFLRVAFKY